MLWDALGSFTEWNFPDVGGESSASNDLGGVEMYIATLGVAILRNSKKDGATIRNIVGRVLQERTHDATIRGV